MKEYRIAKGWAIFIYLIAPFLIALFGALLFLPFLDDSESTPIWFWFLIPISLGMIGLLVVALVDTIKGKVVIDNEKICSVGTFSNRQLFFDEIKGYRENNNYIFIEPKIPGRKKIKISTYVGKSHEILSWLHSNYSNLDVLAAIQEQQEVLQNADYGRTTEERKEKLNIAKRTAKILNWSGGIVGAWTLFWPSPYEYAILGSVIIPLFALIAFKFSSGLIRVDEKNNSAMPSILWAIMAPGMALALRALLDFNIFDHSNVWKPTIFLTVAFVTVILMGNKEFNYTQIKTYISIFAICLIIFAFSYGSIITLNCYYDKSPAEIYMAKILKKRINTGKTTTYHFELTPWGNRTEIEEVSVSEKLYNQLREDDFVRIYLRNGQFEIPWFILTE